MTTITRDELHSLLTTHANLVLLEALPETYFHEGHLPGARAFPLDQARTLARTLTPDRTTPIVVYCASETCRNSDEAAKLLTSTGYTNVRVYVGGKAEWQAANLPIER